ncbi:MAG: glycogen/starch/alpha-glucan phosphorylase, partial [Alphaproteobacteria bacterium]|nr:glycogen/starch/alpha-glucan phosphorylase [Alphaproteobacteria bacterium]
MDLQAPPIAVATPAADARSLAESILRKLLFDLGKSQQGAQRRDWFMAAALATRDQVIERWLGGNRSAYHAQAKQVYYLSLEFLIGRLLRDTITNLGIADQLRDALAILGVPFDEVRSAEPDAALGNGGLGRLAACFMESLASLGIPAFGYGIRYDHGLFRQQIMGGWQREVPEDWLTFGNPWEFARPEIAHEIGFGGNITAIDGRDGPRQLWQPGEIIQAVAYDTPIIGWRGRHVNTLRLWSARASDPLSLEAFNHGDHVGALADQVRQEAISKVLYPGDETPAGQELRLRQEYFFASAALQDLVRRHMRVHGDLHSLPDRVAIQLNDTHPAIAVAELMRICVDLHGLSWEEGWRITQGSISYTNHTLLPEALESWPVPLMERLLPRHMQIIYLINAHHLDAVAARHPGNDALLASVSLIGEGHARRVKQTVFHDFNMLFPGRIVNKTNGITFRRWLHQANPGLSALLREAVGERVLDDPQALELLRPLADDAAFQQRFMAVKHANKAALAAHIRAALELKIDPGAMFDVQIKRIHEYKRQLLNILEAVALYDAMRDSPTQSFAPRVKIFAGKAAASYHRAKLIIKLAHDVGRVINADPVLRDRLKLVFLPNYNVSAAEVIVPAADLSEQISTAGMEASGTGNMKLALNGALTMGTLDGANVEILEHVGAENIHIFGKTTPEVAEHRAHGIRGQAAVDASPRLAQVLEAIRSGVFSPDDPERYHGLVDDLLNADHFLVLADFDSYYEAQRAAEARWNQPRAWARAAILNTANLGWFSADRTIAEYAEDI